MLWIFFVYVEGESGQQRSIQAQTNDFHQGRPEDCLFNQQGKQKFSLTKDFQRRTEHVGTFTVEGEKKIRIYKITSLQYFYIYISSLEHEKLNRDQFLSLIHISEPTRPHD